MGYWKGCSFLTPREIHRKYHFRFLSYMLSSPLSVLLLAASATALNLGLPVLRSTQPSLRRVSASRYAQPPWCPDLRQPRSAAPGSH